MTDQEARSAEIAILLCLLTGAAFGFLYARYSGAPEPPPVHRSYSDHRGAE